MSDTVGDCSTCGLPLTRDGVCPTCKHTALFEPPDSPEEGEGSVQPAAIPLKRNALTELGESLVILLGYSVIIAGYVWLAKTTDNVFLLGAKTALWIMFMHLVMGVLMVFVALLTHNPGAGDQE